MNITELTGELRSRDVKITSLEMARQYRQVNRLLEQNPTKDEQKRRDFTKYRKLALPHIGANIDIIA